VPIELSALFAPGPVVADPPVCACVRPIPADADGDADTPPTCAVPTERDALFPPPACTEPAERWALFPLPLTCVGAEAEACTRLVETDADGAELVADACAVAAECDAVLPPPAWTLPTELVAVLPPDPATVVGADTDAVVPAVVADADGDALTPPTWTVPTEPVAVFPPPVSASAGPAVARAAAAAIAQMMRCIAVSFFSRCRVTRPASMRATVC
jgi:hypothetical protein